VGEHLGEWPGPLVEEDSGQVSRCSSASVVRCGFRRVACICTTWKLEESHCM
jgi:hypothetical protein